MCNSPSKEEKSQWREGKVNNAPSQPPKPTLHITIPPLKPPTTSHTPTPSTTSPKTNDTQAATKATSPSPARPPPSLPPSSQDPHIPENALIFREIHWDRGKTSPASSISAHSPLSDTMGRIPYISPGPSASKRAVEGDRSLEEVLEGGGKEERKADPQTRVEPWLRDIEGLDRDEMVREVERRAGRRRI